jgi:hypothetical protein
MFRTPIVAHENCQANQERQEFFLGGQCPWRPMRDGALFMLERKGLAIGPWTANLEPGWEKGPHLRRPLRELDSPTMLGFVEWCQPKSSWLGWCRGMTLSVFETLDASLVMTLYRPWWPFSMWQVRDADDRRIGTFYRHFLFDGLGYWFAYLQAEAPGTGKFFTRTGVEMGSWQQGTAGETCLTFAQVPESSPFARMILLGMVLSWHLPERHMMKAKKGK